jgi:hypothetical protein
MFTRAQLALLRISALICLGFILGLLALSPSFNPLIERDAHSATVDHRDQMLGRDGAIDCSDLNSASCRELRASYESYLGQGRERNENEAPDRLRSEADGNGRGGRHTTKLTRGIQHCAL